jgi:Tol biopolymer transport system component
MQIIHSYIPISMEGWIGKVDWSPDNIWLAAITMGERTRADLWVMRVDGTEKYDMGSNVSDPVWSPDGRLVFNQYPNSGSFLEQQVLTVTPGNWTQLRVDELPMGSIPVFWGTPAR